MESEERTEQPQKIREVIERLASDPEFRKRFDKDPARAVQAAGYAFSAEELQVLVDEASEGGEQLDKRVMM
jgi:putative modified peptide